MDNNGLYENIYGELPEGTAEESEKSGKKDKKKLFSKIGKKTVIASMAVLVIGVAVLLNFIMMKDSSEAVDMSEDLSHAAAILGVESEEVSEEEDYFSLVALNRESARDEAMEVLLSVADSDSAVEEVKNDAYSDMEQIALDIENEANIESLMRAKGFEECLAVVNGTEASIIVRSEGLTPGEVAQISEIVFDETGILPSNLKIIEKN